MIKVIKIFIILISVFLVLGCTSTQPTEQTTTPTSTPTSTPISTPAPISQETEAVATEQGISISLQAHAFNPSDVTISVGDTVTWTNNDPGRHAIRIGNENSYELPAGGSYSYTFNEAGTFYYVCSFHPNERGTIIVE